MISPDTISDIEQTARRIRQEADRSLAVFFNEVLSRAAAVSALGNSRISIQMIDVATKDFERRAEALRREALSAVATHDVQISSEDVSTLLELINTRIIEARDHVRTELMSHRHFQASAFGPSPGDALIASIRLQFDETSSITVQKQEIETRRGLTKMTRVHADKANLTQNFFGPVAAVISGDKNVTEINQTFNAEGVAALSSALSAVIDKLEKYEPPSDAQREEIGELIELAKEAKAEADKPKPNKLKLISALQGVGAAVNLINDLPELYGMLKAGANSIGIELP